MAEERETLAAEEQVDQMLKEVLGHEYPPLMTFWEKLEKDMPMGLEGHGIILYSSSGRTEEVVTAVVRGAYTSWYRGSLQRETPTYVTADAFPPGSIEERHSSTHDQPHKEEDVEKLRSENSILHKKVLLLQNEVLSFYDIVQFAAAVVFFLCALSIPVWLAFDIRLLSPLLSIIGIMGSSAFWVMGWFGKREFIKGKMTNESVESSKPEDIIKGSFR